MSDIVLPKSLEDAKAMLEAAGAAVATAQAAIEAATDPDAKTAAEALGFEAESATLLAQAFVEAFANAPATAFEAVERQSAAEAKAREIEEKIPTLRGNKKSEALSQVNDLQRQARAWQAVAGAPAADSGETSDVQTEQTAIAQESLASGDGVGAPLEIEANALDRATALLDEHAGDFAGGVRLKGYGGVNGTLLIVDERFETITVIGPPHGRRRAGFTFGPEPRTVTIDAKQKELIEADPSLSFTVGVHAPAGSFRPSYGRRLTVRDLLDNEGNPVPVTVLGPAAGRRRAGRQFTAEPVTFLPTHEQLEQLVADLQLSIAPA